MTELLLFFSLGIACLWKGGDWLVKGSSNIGKYFKLSPLMIGLTLVAFGTSAPELIVNVIASMQNKPDIVFGNIIGSNLSNTLLILGFSGIIFPLSINKQDTQKETIYNIVFPLLLVTLLLFVPPFMILTRIKSILLLVIFAYFLYNLFQTSHIQSIFTSENTYLPMPLSIAFLIIGLILLPIGGYLVVNSASEIALSLGISQAMVSLIAVALGTSLPELATSIMAAINHENDIAIGNILGSNIFNIGLVLSISSLLSPLAMSLVLLQDLYTLLVVSLLFAVAFISRKSHQLHRAEAGTLLVGYIAYTLFVFIRG